MYVTILFLVVPVGRATPFIFERRLLALRDILRGRVASAAKGSKADMASSRHQIYRYTASDLSLFLGRRQQALKHDAYQKSSSRNIKTRSWAYCCRCADISVGGFWANLAQLYVRKRIEMHIGTTARMSENPIKQGV
jgi:hypothetical protein